MVSWGTIPVGSVLAGFLLDHYGGTAPLAALSGLMFAVAIAVTLSPALRAAPDAEISPEHTGPALEKATVSRNRESL
jgi:F0F1-type ATP synthase assembly protein I